jgi:MoaA/NifB/PqqE/SkfB family radical SAM enzyme
MNIDLKDYFCDLPFTYTEIHKDRQTLCCPYWNDTNLKKSPDYLANWFSKEAEDVRDSMLDGTFKKCSTEFCPHLNQLVNKGQVTGPIHPISEFKKENYNKPKRIKLCFDETCNLKCPSCRTRLIANTEERTKFTMNELTKLELNFSDELEEIFTSGTGDPFYSKPMREYLIDFPVEKYPKLKKIIIHTNGILWTPKIWGMLHKVHRYITEVEISVDAATKDTYENKTRLGGKWDVLMDNLKFINSIDTVNKVTTSFVVQKDNYKEMDPFVKLMKGIFGGHKDHTTYFYRVNNWGTYSNEQWNRLNIFEKNHPEHSNFVNEVRKLNKYNKIIANLYEENSPI